MPRAGQQRVETPGDFLRRADAFRRVALEHRGDKFVEPWRFRPSERRNRIVQDRMERGRVVVAGEELLSGHALPEHHTERPEVGARVEGLGPDLLRGHVRDLPLYLAGVRVGGLRGALRDPEIEEFHTPITGYEDVVRRDVTVNDLEGAAVARTRPMGVPEPPRGTGHDGHGHRGPELLPTEDALLEETQEVGAIQPFHRDEREMVHFTHLDDGDDVGVPQLRGDARLGGEHAHEAVGLREVRQHALDYHHFRGRTVVRDAPRQENLCHAATRKLTDDFVARRRHRLRVDPIAPLASAQ